MKNQMIVAEEQGPFLVVGAPIFWTISPPRYSATPNIEPGELQISLAPLRSPARGDPNVAADHNFQGIQ